jgi:hypothetical protein
MLSPVQTERERERKRERKKDRDKERKRILKKKKRTEQPWGRQDGFWVQGALDRRNNF